MPKIVYGLKEHDKSLASLISDRIGVPMATTQHRIFPDGEAYVRVEGGIERGEEVVIVNTMYPDTDRSLVSALLLADAVKGMGASSIALVSPYMAYSRQDRVFLRGEPVSVRAVLRALASAGLSHVITVEIHSKTLHFFPGTAVSLDPFSYMARAIGGEYDMAIAPDRGAIDRAVRVARELSISHDYLEKRRDRITGEISLKPKSFKVRGKKLLLVDDIMSTGGTIAKATEALLNSGAERVDVMVAHLLGVRGSIERVLSSGASRLIAANTLPPVGHGRVEYVDVTPVISSAVLEWLEGKKG